MNWLGLSCWVEKRPWRTRAEAGRPSGGCSKGLAARWREGARKSRLKIEPKPEPTGPPKRLDVG